MSTCVFVIFRNYILDINNSVWEQRKFSSVFEGLQNNTLSRAELNYESGTVKNVHYGDVLIKFGDYIDASEAELPYISDDAKADKFKNSFLQDGDIIIADTAEDDTVGKCTEIQGSKGLKLLSGLHTIACRPKEKYGPMFLGYYINSPAYHSQLKPLMQGIKVTSISKSALQDTDMIMPKSIDEQIKIGEYFSYLDNLITLHQRKKKNPAFARFFLRNHIYIFVLQYITYFIHSNNSSSDHFNINRFKISSINTTHIWKLSSFNLSILYRCIVNLCKIKSHVI